MDYRKSEGIWYENAIAKRLTEAGYTNVRTTSASGDKGADLLWTHPNGTKYVGQCKYYSLNNKVSSDAVSAVHAARSLYGCDHAIIFTSSTLTPQAKKMAHDLDVYVEEMYNPAVDTTRIHRVCAQKQTSEINKDKSLRFVEFIKYLDQKILKRDNNKILSMDNDGFIFLWQYIDTAVVNEADVLALYKIKDFFSGAYGCDGIIIVTSGIVTNEAKERILNLGGYAYEHQHLDDKVMTIIRQERARKSNINNTRQSIENGTQNSPKTSLFTKVCPKCGDFQSKSEKIRFCPKCGSRILTSHEVDIKRRNERIQSKINSATTEELIDGHIALLIASGYKVLHREDNIVFVLAGEEILMCPYINGNIEPNTIYTVVSVFEKYKKLGLEATGVLITASGDISNIAVDEIKKNKDIISISTSTNTRLTKEAIHLLDEIGTK